MLKIFVFKACWSLTQLKILLFLKHYFSALKADISNLHII